MHPRDHVRHLPRDPQLVATVRERRPLLCAVADPDLDLPPHVRAGSALAWRGDRLVVVQDDTHALAVVGGDGAVTEVPLPAGPDGVRQFDDARGNKHLKADLEAVLVVDDVLVALGSGSLPDRERWAVWSDGAPEWADAATVYAAVRTALGDVEVNVEGAALVGDRLVLLQRGNGRGRFDALVELDADVLDAVLDGAPIVPAVRRVVPLELGALAGVRLTPTDLVTAPRGLAFVATAEDAPDAIQDGPVVGGAVGWLDTVGGGWAPLREADGRRVLDKVEGLAFGADGDLWVVTDPDDPTRPSELLRVSLHGFPWPRRATGRAGGAP